MKLRFARWRPAPDGRSPQRWPLQATCCRATSRESARCGTSSWPDRAITRSAPDLTCQSVAYVWSVSRRFRSLIRRRTPVRGSASAIAAAGRVGLGLRGSRTPAPGGRDGRLRLSRSRIRRIAAASAVPMYSIVRPRHGGNTRWSALSRSADKRGPGALLESFLPGQQACSRRGLSSAPWLSSST
jgi:hypothetical protein